MLFRSFEAKNVVKINGQVFSGTDYMQVDISGTTNKNLRIEVFEDSNATVASSTYTLSVSRRDLSGKNVDLKGFEFSNVELTTVFNTREINYYAYVPESMNTVELKVRAERRWPLRNTSLCWMR